MGLHVKTKGHYYNGERKATLNPGSVVLLDNDNAHQFVKRGLGTLCTGPEFDAPAKTPEEIEDELTRPVVERQDLSAKLKGAEKMVSPAQRGAI